MTYIQKQLTYDQKVEVINLFSEKLNEVIKHMIVPVFYKTLVWFYSPSIDPVQLNSFREDLIIIITNKLVEGTIAEYILALNRFQTLQEEITLSNKSYINQT